MDFHSGPPDPGSPDGDPFSGDAIPGDGGDEGPLHPWLPPEDRLWRHPSEGAPVIRPSASESRSTTLTSTFASGWRATCVVAVIAGLVGAAAVSGVAIAGGWWSQTTVYKPLLQSTPVVPASTATSSGSQINWSQVDDLVADSIVSITVQGATGTQQGSGVLMLTGSHGEGYIVTDLGLVYPSIQANYEVKINVSFLSGDAVPGKLIGWDSRSHLAVIAVYDTDHASAATAGTVADLNDAAPVMALGARSQATLATGEVSGQDRSVSLSDGSDLDNLIAVSMPQTAAGVAGGPVVDQLGEVVGITLSLQPVDTSAQQFTYAEPIDEVKSVLGEVVEDKPLSHAWFGVTDAENLPATAIEKMDLSGGVTVGAVTPNSPAARCGILGNDVLTAFAGRAMNSAGQLVSAVATLTPDTPVKVVWVHAGQTHQCTAEIGQEPLDAP